MPTKQIYLDHSATTPVHPDVVAAMLPCWTEDYGNPASVHQFGRNANRHLEAARLSVAQQLNAQPKEIIFTGGGSESDNMALRGAMLAARENGRGNHLITCTIEHNAIVDTAIDLRDNFGFELTLLPVDEFGQVSVADVEGAIRPNTVLISIMAANNEIGTMQPIEAIGTLARQHDILFHTDAVQAIGTSAWDMETMPIDMMTLAPHKFYGPKGVGVLYVRSGDANGCRVGVTLKPFMTGGGQENGLRPGTVNVPLIVGAAKALEIAQTERIERNAHFTQLRDTFISRVLTALPDDCVLTGHPTERLPFHTSFALKNLRGNDLLMHLDMGGIAASSGSACSVGNPKPSAILEALGLGSEYTTGGLRFTFGTQNSLEDVDTAVEVLVTAVRKLKALAIYQ